MLNLVVKKVFNNKCIEPILTKCRKLVGSFKHSSSMSEKLSDIIKNLHKETNSNQDLYMDEQLEIIERRDENRCQTKLVQDLSTRWNSTLAMLKSIHSKFIHLYKVV